MSATINHRMTLHQGRVFKLAHENYTLNSGVTAEMDFIQHPGAVAVVPMLDQKNVLLIKQYRHAVREFIWEIPAGTLDSRESPLGCAKRELIEETGYSAGEWHPLGKITPLPGYSDERIRIFLASELKPAEQHLDKDEMLSVHRMRFKAALQMILKGEIQDGKTISALFLASKWLEKNRSEMNY